MDDRQPRFVHSKDLDIGHLEEDSVDFVWALTVVSHMPIEDITRLMRAARRILRPGGAFIFDYIESDGSTCKTSVKDYTYPSDTIEGAAREAGFAIERLETSAKNIPPEWLSEGARALKLVA